MRGFKVVFLGLFGSALLSCGEEEEVESLIGDAATVLYMTHTLDGEGCSTEMTSPGACCPDGFDLLGWGFSVRNYERWDSGDEGGDSGRGWEMGGEVAICGSAEPRSWFAVGLSVAGNVCVEWESSGGEDTGGWDDGSASPPPTWTLTVDPTCCPEGYGAVGLGISVLGGDWEGGEFLTCLEGA